MIENIKKEDIFRILDEAHTAILNIYNNDELFVEYKKDNSPLTLADKASNKIICDNLKQLYPDIPILSEENKSIDYNERKDYEYYWCIDPIDGTKEFIKKNGEFTVNIALMYKKRPVIGFVSVPCTGDIYYAYQGEGAYKTNLSCLVEFTKLKCNKYSLDDENLRIVCSRSHINDDTLEFINCFKNSNIVRVGSSLKLLWIAEGSADIYPRLGPTMEWDTAAAHAIVVEAGGKVVKIDLEELEYNKEDLLNPYFIVYGQLE